MPETSHPVWVRGLKQVIENFKADFSGSHPVWVRGLKQQLPGGIYIENVVAPRVGAWIETYTLRSLG